VIDYIKGKIKWVRSTDFLAVLTLFFSSLLFFYDLFHGRYLLTERDLGPYFIPPRFFWVESIKDGVFPLWNPYQFSGHPFFANPQNAILYPLNGLFFSLPFDVAFNAIIILHFFLGGLFTYLFLKDLKVSVTGSLLSGLIFMLSGYLLSVHSLLTILLSSVWTPLIMMFFRRAILSPGRKNEMLTSIFMTISFLGGGVEIVYGNFLILLVMVIFPPFPYIGFVGDKPRRYKFLCSVPIYWGRIKGLFNRFRSLLIVSIVFLLLSAIQFIPFLELWIHSIRAKGISYQEATIWSFAPKDVLLFILPDVYGYFVDMKKYWINQCWFKTLYTGGLPFILSLIFFLSPRRILVPKADCLVTPLCHCERPKGACLHAEVRFGTQAWQPQFYLMRLLRSFHSLAMTLRYSPEGGEERVRECGRDRTFYLSLIILSLFLSLGQYNPLYPFVFKHVPFFNGIRYPAKFLYIFILILSITAGLGFQKLTEYSREGGNKKLKNLLILFSVVSGLFLLFLILGHKDIEHFLKGKGIDIPDFSFVSINLYHAKRFFFYLTLFFLLLRVGHEVKWKTWAKVLLIFFLTADLFGNMGFYGKEKTTEYLRKTRILEMISSDKGHFRVFTTSKTISMDIPILIAGTTSLDFLKEKHLPSINMLYQLHNIWGIDVMHLKRVDDLYITLINTSSISDTLLIDLYGVKYVISVTLIEKDPRFELIYSRLEGLQGKKEDLLRGNTIKLYRKKDAHRRAWLVKSFKVLDSKEILSKLKSKDFHPDKEVLLEEDPLWVTPTSDLRPPTFFSGLPEFISETNNRLRLHVKANENSLLVLSDTYFPGWKVFVDGKEEKIYQANYNFRAVALSAGTHQVEFVYDPLSFKLGALITFLGILGCLAIVLARKERKKLWMSKKPTP